MYRRTLSIIADWVTLICGVITVFTVAGAWSGGFDVFRRNSSLGPVGVTGIALGASVFIWVFLFLAHLRLYSWYAEKRREADFLFWFFTLFVACAIYIVLQLLVLDKFFPGIQSQDAYKWVARGLALWLFGGIFGAIFVQTSG